MSKKRLFLVTIFLLSQSFPLQTKAKSTPTITVKATPVNPTEHTVNAEEVSLLRRITSVVDLFKDTPGVIFQNSQFGKKVFIKGLDDEKYRIMINGIPLANRGTYHTRGFEWDTIPYENVKAVKLVEGPFSAEYGYQSGGVIDLITEKPKEGLDGRISLEGGKFNEHQESFLLNAGTKNFGLISTGRFLETDSQLDHHHIKNYDFSLLPTFQFNNLKVSSLFFHNYKKEKYPFDKDMKFNIYEKWKYEPGSYFEYSNDYYNVNLNYNSLNFNVYYNEQERKDYPETYYVKSKNGYKKLPYKLEYNMDHTNVYFPGLKLKWSQNFPVLGKLKLGFEFRRPKSRVHFLVPFLKKNSLIWLNEYVRVHNNMYALFGELKKPLGEDFSSTTGVRFDWFNFYGSSNRYLPNGKLEKLGYSSDKHHFSFSETLTFSPSEKFSSYASVGTIFTPPTIMDYFRWLSNYSLSARARGVVLGTPSLKEKFVVNGQINKKKWQKALGKLKPETGYGVEMGAKYKLNGLSLKLIGFYSYINDYIAKYPTNHAPTYNVDSVKLYGFNLDGSKPVSDFANLRVSITYENTRKSGDRLLDSKRLPNVPKWKLDGYLTLLPYENLYITPSVHYVGKRPTGGAPLRTIDTLGGYTTYNLAVNYLFKNFQFDFLVENIFNRKAYERIDSPITERCFTFRVTKEF
jgi:outer membrane receptor protein involved in Fe transport